MSDTAYIDYDAYKSALDDLERSGVAHPIVLPFAAHSGQVVNIDGKEYRLAAGVTDEGIAGVDAAADAIVGYKVTKL